MCPFGKVCFRWWFDELMTFVGLPLIKGNKWIWRRFRLGRQLLWVVKQKLVFDFNCILQQKKVLFCLSYIDSKMRISHERKLCLCPWIIDTQEYIHQNNVVYTKANMHHFGPEGSHSVVTGSFSLAPCHVNTFIPLIPLCQLRYVLLAL